MKKILGEITNGKFAKQWLDENKKGRPNFNKARQVMSKHRIEIVGSKLRAMMPWLRRNI